MINLLIKTKAMNPLKFPARRMRIAPVLLWMAVFLLWLVAAADAQTFRKEAPVAPVPADGFYRVLLPPSVTSNLKQDFSDVRIYDKDSIETPYLVYKDEAHQGVDRFVTYQIVEKHLVHGCCSHITVRNSLGNAIDHIVLEVNNADASREMTLSGSYDGENWYAVKDHFTVSSFNTMEKGERKTTSLIRFDFPLTDYRFYRFDFDDWYWWWHDYDYHHYPVFVVRAGYTEPTFIPEECLELPKPSIVQTDSMKRKESYVRINFPEDEYVDHVRFSISTKKKGKDYYRAAALYEVVERNVNGKKITEEIPVGTTILSSVNENEINLSTERVRALVLRISNEDNQPLIVDSVKAFQVKHYLVAELEKDNHYVMRFGNDSLYAPSYELRYFKAKIPAAPPVVSPGAVTDISTKNISPQTMKGLAKNDQLKAAVETSLLHDKRFIWIAIGAVVLLLGFMTTKMLKEMK